MKIGDKLLLHKVPFPHQSQDMDEFVAITVTEEKTDVPDMWSGSNTCKGYRAVSENGDLFELNWNSFPSDSMTPHWMWFNETNSEAWYDVTYVHGVLFKPIFIDRYPFVKYCEKHGEIYYEDGITGCFDCYMEQNYGKDRQSKKPVYWQGWR